MATQFGTSNPISRNLAIIIVPAFVLVLIEIYALASLQPDLRRNQTAVTHTLQVIATARALDNAVRDAESGGRGFIITGNQDYLDAYNSGVHEAPLQLAELKQLTADNPEQQSRIALLETQIRIKFDELKRAIDARQAQGFDAARQIVESNVGLNSMRVIEGLIGFAIGAENKLLDERQAQSAAVEHESATINTAIIAATLIVMFIGTILLSRTLQRYFRASAELTESEERFALLVSGVKDYAIFMLDPEGRVLSWNEGAARLKGYSADEIISSNFSRFYLPKDAAAGMPAAELRQATTAGSVQAEGPRLRKDGSQFIAHVTITALRAKDGTLRGFAKVTRDITEQVANQKALDESRSALTQAQKMEAIGQLTGGVAHDFNNLLTAIIGGIDLLQRQAGTLTGEKSAELLGVVRKAAEQATSLVRQLLAFSRRQTLSPQSVDLNRLVGRVSELLRRTLGEEIVLETVLAGGLWPVHVDANQLENALVNLAINARDAMPEGGKLTIESGNTYLDDEYARVNSEVTSGQYVVLAVSDTGRGMAPEVMVRAFEPFFSTKPVGKGTGLGLSQVFGFVKQSGGHLKLYSEMEHGSTVKIYLPRYLGALPAERQEQTRAVIARGRGQTVLVVEDEPLVRMYDIEALTSLGYDALEAVNGKEALDLLEQHPETVLLFTDVGLPGGINGRQLATEAQRRIPGLKVLFTTGHARNAIVHHGILDPGVELLEKPFTVENLGRKLQQILGGAST